MIIHTFRGRVLCVVEFPEIVNWYRESSAVVEFAGLGNCSRNDLSKIPRNLCGNRSKEHGLNIRFQKHLYVLAADVDYTWSNEVTFLFTAIIIYSFICSTVMATLYWLPGLFNYSETRMCVPHSPFHEPICGLSSTAFWRQCWTRWNADTLTAQLPKTGST